MSIAIAIAVYRSCCYCLSLLLLLSIALIIAVYCSYYCCLLLLLSLSIAIAFAIHRYCYPSLLLYIAIAISVYCFCCHSCCCCLSLLPFLEITIVTAMQLLPTCHLPAEKWRMPADFQKWSPLRSSCLLHASTLRCSRYAASSTNTKALLSTSFVTLGRSTPSSPCSLLSWISSFCGRQTPASKVTSSASFVGTSAFDSRRSERGLRSCGQGQRKSTTSWKMTSPHDFQEFHTDHFTPFHP